MVLYKMNRKKLEHLKWIQKRMRRASLQTNMENRDLGEKTQGPKGEAKDMALNQRHRDVAGGDEEAGYSRGGDCNGPRAGGQGATPPQLLRGSLDWKRWRRGDRRGGRGLEGVNAEP